MPLGESLDRVRNQWLHVAAFGALGAAIGSPFGGSAYSAHPPPTAEAMGTAAALGRAQRLENRPDRRKAN